ncbi:hypothetical protein MSG28_014480 [Choristoneura fumiferana]|uniref:Uncharacterized protein n=1 Tax=Choristoneura fumiferana TaxID=7141 RepID=A0ACC0JS66_CHOFU|nr:hypothetical protein MSG28_014480 [Choristoneura fumiferana]
MEWTLKENQIAVLALHRCGQSPSTIFKLLKNLNITLRFIYRTIDRYNEVSSVEDKKRIGRPRSVRTPAVIKAIKARIARNPVRKQKLMPLQLLQSVDEDISISGEHKTPSRQVSPNPLPVSASPHTRSSFVSRADVRSPERNGDYVGRDEQEKLLK